MCRSVGMPKRKFQKKQKQIIRRSGTPTRNSKEVDTKLEKHLNTEKKVKKEAETNY